MAREDVELTITPNGGAETHKPLTLMNKGKGKMWSVSELNNEVMPTDRPFFVQNTWHGGFGQGNFRDPTRYADGVGIDTTHKGLLFLGPAITSSTISTGGGMGAAPVDFEVFNISGTDTLFCATGLKIYQWNTTNSNWVLKETFTGDAITQLHSFGGYMFVARGADTAYSYTANGADYTTCTLTDKYADGFLTAPAGAGTTMILWKFKTPNEISSHATGINGATEWATVSYIGDTSADITNLLLPFDNLFVGRADNLYHYDADGKSYPLMTELELAKSTNNFKHIAGYHGSWYFSLGSRVGEITAYNSFDEMGPLSKVEDVDKVGTCVGLAADRNYLYAIMDEGTNSVIYKGFEDTDSSGNLFWSWCPWAFLSTNACATAFVAQLASENPKLWFGYGNTAGYCILSDYPLADSSYSFGATGYLVTSWFDAGARDWYKILDAVMCECKGTMFATKSVTLYFEDDEDGTWTQIDTAYTAATSASTAKKYADTAPPSFKKIRFKIAFANS